MGNEILDKNEAKIEGRLHGEQIEPEQPDNMVQRFIYMMLIAIMISLAQTVLGVATVVQFVVMLVDKKQPNERLADFGTDLGIWIAKAARFQTAASNVKPWPWTELDKRWLLCTIPCEPILPLMPRNAPTVAMRKPQRSI